MSRTSFVVSFDGRSLADGNVDIRELAPALLSLGRLIDNANRALHGADKKIKVEAVATRHGSFEVFIDVVLPFWESIKSLVSSEDVQAAEALLSWIGLVGGGGISLISLLRFLRGRRISKVSRDQATGLLIVNVAGDDGDTSIVVPFEVLRLYQEIAVQREVANLLDVLKEEAIEEIRFRGTTGRPAVEDVRLTLEDREWAVVPEIEPEVVIDTTQKMALSIRSLAFQEGNKWRLFDGQNIIVATIEDRDFLGRVDASIERFAKGDVLICRVRTIQRQTADGLKTDHVVQEVLEHRSPPTQIELPLDPEPRR